MIPNSRRPFFRKKVLIEGNCLFLVGPIGTFFARLSRYLEDNNVRTFKILFPLHEYGFPQSRVIKYSKDINFLKKFLRRILIKHEIKHIFMYGNVLIPHKQALDLVKELNIEGKYIKTHIFELGYLRPNFVTLENKGINYNSSLIKSREFYLKQDAYSDLPLPSKHARFRIRKIWKTISFIHHSFKNYKIVEKEHKLQPKPIYIWYQIKGFFLKYFFFFTEYKLKNYFLRKKYFLVILQVSTDSQLTEGSDFKDNKKFIYKVIKDFAESKRNDINLVFKHHPRDRGYNNYLDHIEKISKEFGVYKNVFYIHDYYLSKLFQNSNCTGTVLINSTVGYQSLYHSIPVKSLGITPYNIKGLSHQEDLTSFFKNPSPVDKLLFTKFYKYILENSQINGNFDGFFPFKNVFVTRK